jgi:hypothetical protein
MPRISCNPPPRHHLQDLLAKCGVRVVHRTPTSACLFYPFESLGDSRVGLCIIPNMLEILDQLPDSYLAFAGRLSEITARAMHYGIESAGQLRYTFFAHAQ